MKGKGRREQSYQLKSIKSMCFKGIQGSIQVHAKILVKNLRENSFRAKMFQSSEVFS